MSNADYVIPGGHCIHPSFPLEEELENVPLGHGRNVRWPVCLNPEATRAEITSVFSLGTNSLTASASESIGFLGYNRRTTIMETIL